MDPPLPKYKAKQSLCKLGSYANTTAFITDTKPKQTFTCKSFKVNEL